jgi:DNA repair protein RecO
MEERATGIVLRLRPLTETSLIVHWLCLEQGRIATVAKGARRPQSVFRGKLDLCFHLDFSFHRSRTSELHQLREAQLNRTFPELRTDWHRLQLASYAVALIECTTEHDTPIPGGYPLLLSFLECIASEPPRPFFVLALEAKWLTELGLMPDITSGPLKPDLRQYLRVILTSDWRLIARLHPEPRQARELNLFLQKLLLAHIGRLPAGRSVLQEYDE